MNRYFTRPIFTIGLVFVVQLLHAQIHIKVVDKENNPIPWVEAHDTQTDSLLSRSSYDGIITMQNTNVATVKLVSFNYIDKIISINKMQANDTIILVQKEIPLKDVTVNAAAPDRALVISAYVRNYTLINDSLSGYLDAIVDYVIPTNAEKGSAKIFLKQYRIFARKAMPQKKRWIEITPADVSVPRFDIKSVLDTQKYSVLANDSIVYKKYPDSVAGSINIKDSTFEIKIDRPIFKDTAVHDFLGYRIKFLNTIKEEKYRISNNNFSNKISRINNLMSKYNYQKILFKHKEEKDFIVVKSFSDIIILNTNYVYRNKLKEMQSIKLDREKSSYQTPFWNAYMNTLPNNVMEMLKNSVLPDF